MGKTEGEQNLGAGRENREASRIVVSEVRLMDTGNRVEVQAYIGFLNHPDSIRHFSNPPKNISALRKLCRTPGIWVLSALGIGEDGEERIVGGMAIEDAAPNQHDHFLTTVVVDPNLRGRGIGRQMLIKGIDFAATTLTADKRIRNKLDVAIAMRVEGWEVMDILIESLGFEFRQRLPKEVDVPVLTEDGKLQYLPSGQIVKETKPTVRWELDLERWRATRELVMNEVPGSQ